MARGNLGVLFLLWELFGGDAKKKGPVVVVAPGPQPAPQPAPKPNVGTQPSTPKPPAPQPAPAPAPAPAAPADPSVQTGPLPSFLVPLSPVHAPSDVLTWMDAASAKLTKTFQWTIDHDRPQYYMRREPKPGTPGVDWFQLYGVPASPTTPSGKGRGGT